ncbi:(2Fe-2S)-binding protein [Anaerobranca gottschalkii]|uniref:BFD-like [2Fe-2S] binding domain-containing protein n=1 Tax=Anaerobranca gottschalkii DSM 13577 TaxID=1120990 RepID=A0A1H9ZN39_9FIRM|nr:(2Fe-2S)-binding protein [Anaerobranca gottschalkii]SES83048.1 BFD-like [2Fe-2S] binding domain-containing protein [Anaerobranca gottschalkii DSM 13577]
MGNCNCCRGSNKSVQPVIGEYVCYCNKVTEKDIVNAIDNGCNTVKEVIEMTGAMKNSNCAVNNPKGRCCYPDIVEVFNKYKK